MLAILALLLVVAPTRGCVDWLPSKPNAPFPHNPYDDPFPVNASAANKRYFCGVEGSAGSLVKTTAGWLCETASQTDRSGHYYYPGSYSVVYFRYLNDPKLVPSSEETPIPKNAIKWPHGAATTYMCAANIDGTLTAGQLYSDGRTQCLVTVMYSLGIVTRPFSYQVLVGTNCSISES